MQKSFPDSCETDIQSVFKNSRAAYALIRQLWWQKSTLKDVSQGPKYISGSTFRNS